MRGFAPTIHCPRCQKAMPTGAGVGRLVTCTACGLVFDQDAGMRAGPRAEPSVPLGDEPLTREQVIERARTSGLSARWAGELLVVKVPASASTRIVQFMFATIAVLGAVQLARLPNLFAVSMTAIAAIALLVVARRPVIEVSRIYERVRIATPPGQVQLHLESRDDSLTATLASRTIVAARIAIGVPIAVDPDTAKLVARTGRT